MRRDEGDESGVKERTSRRGCPYEDTARPRPRGEVSVLVKSTNPIGVALHTRLTSSSCIESSILALTYMQANHGHHWHVSDMISSFMEASLSWFGESHFGSVLASF